MDLVHERAAGIDISMDDAKVAIRASGPRAGTCTTDVTTWGANTNQILALRNMPLAAKVTTVLMDAPSDYWRPFYYLFEDVLPVMLVNAKAARNVPGRKTDLFRCLLVRCLLAGPARRPRTPARIFRRSGWRSSWNPPGTSSRTASRTSWAPTVGLESHLDHAARNALVLRKCLRRAETRRLGE